MFAVLSNTVYNFSISIRISVKERTRNSETNVMAYVSREKQAAWTAT